MYSRQITSPGFVSSHLLDSLFVKGLLFLYVVSCYKRANQIARSNRKHFIQSSAQVYLGVWFLIMFFVFSSWLCDSPLCSPSSKSNLELPEKKSIFNWFTHFSGWFYEGGGAFPHCSPLYVQVQAADTEISETAV